MNSLMLVHTIFFIDFATGRACREIGFIRKPPQTSTKIDLAEEPSPGKGPVTVHSGKRHSQGMGNLLPSHADEIAKLHQLSFPRLSFLEAFKRIINSQHLVIILFPHERVNVIYLHSLQPTTPSSCLLPAGVVNQDSPHRFRGSKEKMTLVFKLPFGNSHPNFVYEFSSLKRVATPLFAHAVLRHCPQLLVHRRHQLAILTTTPSLQL
jgi:hypothetical protein